MKKNWTNKAISLLLLIGALLCEACGKDKNSMHDSGETYTCPMHPQINQDVPGTCPVCGMDLVKQSRNKTDVSPNEKQHLHKAINEPGYSSNETVTPEYKTLEFTFESLGIMAYDTRKAYSIPIRFSGRIEKLFVRYNFQSIKKGDKILEIYSPELITAQKELLYLLKENPFNTTVIEASKQKLRFLGLSEGQLNHLIKAKKESTSFAVYSPYTGYITEESALITSESEPKMLSSSDNPGDGMQGDAANATPAPTTTISSTKTREGMYLNAGQTIFRIINTETVWAEFNVYQKDANYIKVNDHVSLSIRGKSNIISTVNFIQPFFQQGENFLKVRINLKNQDRSLKIGTLVTAHFKTERARALYLPITAVVYLGKSHIVFIKKDKQFVPHPVTIGIKTDSWIEIISGLDTTSVVAANGQFLVDSESFINTNMLMK